jgi:hypothetical protein
LTGRRLCPSTPRLEDFDHSRSDVAYVVTVCADSDNSDCTTYFTAGTMATQRLVPGTPRIVAVPSKR